MQPASLGVSHTTQALLAGGIGATPTGDSALCIHTSDQAPAETGSLPDHTWDLQVTTYLLTTSSVAQSMAALCRHMHAVARTVEC
jgi:hypothetical protein